MNLPFRSWLLAGAIAALGCANTMGPPNGPDPEPRPEPPPPEFNAIPLTQLSSNYAGLPGGLYPGGLNIVPPDHAAAGRAALARIEPLDESGQPDPDGAIVLVSVGMSNTAQEFCSGNGDPPCRPWSFTGQALADPAVDRDELVIVNGAVPGKSTVDWDEPQDDVYDRVNFSSLGPAGVTEEQVQVAWVKQANPMPTVSLPSPNADAYVLEAGLGRIVRAMQAHWPNLRIVFFSSRTFGGYAETELNPEPFAYEGGFAVRGVIEAQIEQAETGAVDAEAGDVGLAGGAPWLAWGPYLWADGPNARDDGLVWEREDFADDGTHPSESGEEKVASLLLTFFKSSPFAQCWFLAGRSC